VAVRAGFRGVGEGMGSAAIHSSGMGGRGPKSVGDTAAVVCRRGRAGRRRTHDKTTMMAANAAPAADSNPITTGLLRLELLELLLSRAIRIGGKSDDMVVGESDQRN